MEGEERTQEGAWRGQQTETPQCCKGVLDFSHISKSMEYILREDR